MIQNYVWRRRDLPRNFNVSLKAHLRLMKTLTYSNQGREAP